MKINGKKIRAALNAWREEKEDATAEFSRSLLAFPGETKDPVKAMERVAHTSMAVSVLQAANSEYNSRVKVMVDGKEMPLSLVIKLAGSTQDIVRMWAKAVSTESHDRYGEVGVRATDKVYAVKTISSEDATRNMKQSRKFEKELRAAIDVGNMTEIDLDLDPALLQVD